MKNLLFLSLLMLIINSCNIIRNTIYKPFYYSPKSNYNFTTEVPFSISNGHIFINVKIEGKNCKFVFDTGSKSYISKDLKEELDLFSTRKTNSNDAFDNKVKSEQVTALIQLNSLKVVNFNLTVKDVLENLVKCIKIDGVLGNNILNQGVFYFNPQTKKLKISNSIENINLNRFEKIKLKVFIGDILVKQKGEKFLIDSGYDGFMAIPKSSSIYKDTLPNKHFTELWTGLNATRKVSVTYQEQVLKIGNFNQKGIACYINPFNHFLIGSELFLKNEVIIDVPNKHIYLKRVADMTDEKQFSLSDIRNIRFGYIDGKTVVTSISSEIKSCSIGSEILKINGIDVSNIKSECELNEILGNMEFKNGVSLLINVKNAVEEIYIDKNDLY